MPPRCQLLPRSLHAPRTSLRSPQPTPRTFTTSPALHVRNPLARRRGGDLGSHLPKHVIPKDADIPPYPYGPNLLYKQANKGLYGGKRVQFGNNVSRKTETTTRRDWKPNVLAKGVYSVALKKRIKLRMTSQVLKTMDREGGLDEYLLKQHDRRIKELGPTGWALRWTLMQTPVVIARFRAEAEALGLAQAVIDMQWPSLQMTHERKLQERRERMRAMEASIAAAEARGEDFKLASNAARRNRRQGRLHAGEEGLEDSDDQAEESIVREDGPAAAGEKKGDGEADAWGALVKTTNAKPHARL